MIFGYVLKVSVFFFGGGGGGGGGGGRVFTATRAT